MNDCPLKDNCKVTDKWCSVECLKKSQGHCHVGKGQTPQEALDKAREIIRGE